MSRVSVYFLPRAQAAKARQIGAEPRVVTPVRQISAPPEPLDADAPAKLSRVEAARMLGIAVRIVR